MLLERNLQEIGKSLLVTLPKEWTQLLNLKKGSKVKIFTTEDGKLLIAPEFVEKKEKKEALIRYDPHFTRRFFREYLAGNERISILGVDKTAFGEVHSFLSRFMNVQIIEETGDKIVVKSFSIEELSMEECLKRMYFLSLNMFDEVLNENNDARKDEIEQNLTKFYYLLVMQIRRFLSAGKFFQQEMSLIRALDYRMAAEKIERAADALKGLDELDSTQRDILKNIKKMFQDAFLSFIDENYDNALVIWKRQREEMKKFSGLLDKWRKTKNSQSIEVGLKLIQLLDYSRDISSLVR